jgi:hypothetical protein
MALLSLLVTYVTANITREFKKRGKCGSTFRMPTGSALLGSCFTYNQNLSTRAIVPATYWRSVDEICNKRNEVEVVGFTSSAFQSEVTNE